MSACRVQVLAFLSELVELRERRRRAIGHRAGRMPFYWAAAQAARNTAVRLVPPRVPARLHHSLLDTDIASALRR
jgi:hypothetical protein